MKEVEIKKERKLRRLKRVRRKILQVKNRLRLSVFRSNKYIYAQIIDDVKGQTVVSVSQKGIKTEGLSPTLQAEEVGKLIAKQSLAKKIKEVVFDKGSYRYHGRVKSLAEGARKGGLQF